MTDEHRQDTERPVPVDGGVDEHQSRVAALDAQESRLRERARELHRLLERADRRDRAAERRDRRAEARDVAAQGRDVAGDVAGQDRDEDSHARLDRALSAVDRFMSGRDRDMAADDRARLAWSLDDGDARTDGPDDDGTHRPDDHTRVHPGPDEDEPGTQAD